MSVEVLELAGGRYDGLRLEVPVIEGRPADRPFWLACWSPSVHACRLWLWPDSWGEPPMLAVTIPGSFSTHDDRADFERSLSRFEDAAYFRCKDGRLRAPKFATWVEERAP